MLYHGCIDVPHTVRAHSSTQLSHSSTQLHTVPNSSTQLHTVPNSAKAQSQHAAMARPWCCSPSVTDEDLEKAAHSAPPSASCWSVCMLPGCGLRARARGLGKHHAEGELQAHHVLDSFRIAPFAQVLRESTEMHLGLEGGLLEGSKVCRRKFQQFSMNAWLFARTSCVRSLTASWRRLTTFA